MGWCKCRRVYGGMIAKVVVEMSKAIGCEELQGIFGEVTSMVLQYSARS